jgi:hypothetical protein
VFGIVCSDAVVEKGMARDPRGDGVLPIRPCGYVDTCYGSFFGNWKDEIKFRHLYEMTLIT